MATSWTVGGGAGCDIVVVEPVVSGRHCRLTRVDGGYLLEDLGSTNGTFVNGVRVTGPVRVTQSDSVTLGRVFPFPWPEEGGEARPPRSATVIESAATIRQLITRVGREPDNDLVMNQPGVSGYHARIVRDEPAAGGVAMIQDLGSSNGTFVNGRRVAGSAPLHPGDTVGLGKYTFVFDPPPGHSTARPTPPPPTEFAFAPPADAKATAPESARVLPAVPPRATEVTLSPVGPAIGAPAAPPSLSLGDALAEEFAAVWTPAWVTGLLLAQGPLSALAILGAFRGTESVPATLFWLGLAAVWFGLSAAVFAPGTETKREGAGLSGALARLLVLAAVGVIDGLAAWVVVWPGASLGGSSATALGLILLAACAGLGLGALLVSAVPRREFAWGVLPLLVLTLWAFGGEFWAVGDLSPLVRPVAAAVPTRWAFEGLLLAEGGGRVETPVTLDPARTPTMPPAPAPEGSEVDVEGGGDGEAAEGKMEGTGEAPTPAPAPVTVDWAETYFPARTERMGLRADFLALGSMAVGLVALAAFAATAPTTRRARAAS